MKQFTGSLAWKLTIWFFLLSIFPIVVMAVFVRQNVADTIADLAADEVLSRVILLANEASSAIDDGNLPSLMASKTDETHLAFVLGPDGSYVAHSDPAMVGAQASDELAPEVIQRISGSDNGVVVAADTGQLFGFALMPTGSGRVVLAVDESVVSAPMLKIERTGLVQLAASLALVSIVGGAAIWIVFKPIHQLTRAAEEVGAGNLNVQIDPENMEGELEVLTGAFNQMTRQLRDAHDTLERRVEERTEELRQASENLMALINASPLPIMAFDKGGLLRIWNPAAEDTFGWSEADALGQHLAIIAPEGKQDDARESLTRAMHGEVLAGLETRRRRKDGSQIDVAIWTAPLRDAAGAIEGVMGVIEDLTERKRAEQTMRELAVLGERNRMAREIHDTLAQGFTGIVLQLEAAEQALETSPSEVKDHMSRAKELGRHCLQEARRSVWDLVPQALEEMPFIEALEEVVRQWDAGGDEVASFSLSGERRELDPNVQRTLLRICQESLANVRKHAEAARVTVALSFYSEAVGLRVSDDGVGFDRSSAGRESGGGGFGLTGMEQRTKLLRGDLDIKAADGRGTVVEVRLPT